MSWMYQACQYLVELKDKGFGDESFYNEYDFIGHELHKANTYEVLEESNTLQAEIFLYGEN